MRRTCATIKEDMSDERPIHSMSDRDRAVALDVLTSAWARLDSEEFPTHIVGGPINVALQVAATALPEWRLDVGADYARFAYEAAVWYLDRAIRRVADPERDGWTAQRRVDNLAWYATAQPASTEDVFAMAVALNVEDA